MSLRDPRTIRLILLVTCLLILGGVAAAWEKVGLSPVKDWWKKAAQGSESSGGRERLASASLAAGGTDTLEVPVDVVQKLGIRTAAVEQATKLRPLELAGSINIYADRFQLVRTYWPGEVVQIGTVEASPQVPPPLETASKQISLGDRVSKGQLLAVIYNADLGSKKNDLIDALSQLSIDQKQYDALNELYKKGAATEAMLRQATRNVETDINNARRAESYLRTYRVPEEEIKAVKEEAKRIFERGGQHDPEKEKNWPRVEIRAKLDGTVLERNISLGDVVDTSRDLFKIADLNKLTVWANAYEEDLPALQALRPEQRVWKVRLNADPNFEPQTGAIDYIGLLVDPNQHTVPIRGYVDNSKGLLRAGQFVTATIGLPPPADTVVIPAMALDEDGNDSIVMVRVDPRKIENADPKKEYYAQRRVAVIQRGQQEIYVRSRLKLEQEKQGLQTLQPGDQVVTSGVLLLRATLEDLKGAAKK
jgi:cobalt-zinc-cadmium efflux system membrane fusion protein